MTKSTSLLLLCLSLCFGHTLFAQTDTLFFEDFEIPNYNIFSNVISSGGLNGKTAEVNDLFNNGDKAFRVNTYDLNMGTYYLDLPGISQDSLRTYQSAELHFDFINRAYLFNNVSIEYSTNNKSTWTSLTESDYYGNSLAMLNGALYRSNEVYYRDWFLQVPGFPGSASDSTMWRHEAFEIRNNVSSTSNDSLFIRFVFTVNAKSLANNTDELVFLDNVMLIGSSCNEALPRIKPELNIGTACTGYENMDFISVSAPNTLTFDLDISGQTSYSNLYLETFENGASTSTNYTFNTSNGDLAVPFNTGQENLKYRVVAEDACGGVSYYPTKGYFYYNQSFVSNVCGTNNSCDSGITVVNTFPFKEDFESAAWQGNANPNASGAAVRGSFATGSSHNWTVFPDQSLGNRGFCVQSWNYPEDLTVAPTKRSLPSGGNNYIVYRTDLAGSNVFTNLVTPCINLSNDSNMLLTVDYMSTGNLIASFDVRVRTIKGTQVSSWRQLADLQQRQNSNGNIPFRKALVSLADYQDSVIQIQFRASTNNSSQSSSYVAFDNIEIRQIQSNDVFFDRIEGLDATFCSSGPDSVEVFLYTADTNISAVPIAYQVNTGTIRRDTLNLPQNRLYTDTISLKIEIGSQSIVGSNRLQIWHELNKPLLTADDSIVFDFSLSNPINSFPYFEDFENLSTNSSIPNWEKNNFTLSGGVIDFYVYDGIYPSSESGPSKTLGKGSKYLALASNPGRLYPNGYTVSLTSDCIDPSGLLNPHLVFDYHLNQTNHATIRVEYTLNGINYLPLQTLTSTPLTTPVKSISNWRTASINLNSISQPFKLRIVAEYPNNVNINRLGVAIDNLQIYDRGGADFSLVAIEQTFKGAQLSNVTTYLKSVWGNLNLFDTLQLHLQFDPICGGTSLQTVLSKVIPLRQNQQILPWDFTGFDQVNLLPGQYKLKAWIVAPGDVNPLNDTVTIPRFDVYKLETIPYFNDFESCLEGANPFSEYKVWGRRSSRTGGPVPFSGNFALSTDSLPEGISSAQEMLIMPAFAGFDSVYSPRLSFFHHMMHDGTGRGRLEMSTGGGWVNVDDSKGIRELNWYDPLEDAFTTNTNRRVFSSIEIPSLSSISDTVRFRFVMENVSSTNDWLIDDFRIDIPEQNDVSAINLETQNVVFYNQIDRVDLSVANQGRFPLSQFTVEFLVNGQAWFSDTIKLSSALPFEQRRTLSINTSAYPMPNLSGNAFTLAAIVSNPNNKLDAIAANNTIGTLVQLSPTSTSIPYCLDFESGLAPVVSNTLNFSHYNPLWTNATPNKNSINGAANGNNALVTKASNDYNLLEDGAFYINPFMIADTGCYTLSFNHYFLTEPRFDGGTVEFSIDTGHTWLSLGKEDGDSLWFNTKYVQALEAVNPGFAGNSGGYVRAEKTFNLPFNGLIYIRFRFKTNATVQDEGWAIDDICVEQAANGCEAISLAEANSLNVDLNLYPNPAQTAVWVGFSNPDDQIAHIRLYDATGKCVLDESPLDQFASKKLDISHLSKGLYFVGVTDTKGEVQTKRFVKQ